MTDEQALRKAIAEQPEEDTPRLAYADWLDEANRPDRAEFIRIQIELAPLATDDPACVPLRQRERELWVVHHRTWRAEVPD
ncbi:MAG TPA: TIGR02996 domain-containing protein, partial [Gemmataceae bacterium]|nr:TIGR02996 domain-containing protein [Gemmataceae bacterium]